MSEAVRVTEAARRGMVTLRGDLSDPGLRAAVADVAGAEIPGPGRIALAGTGGVAWMSPDEVLLMLPADAVAGALGRIGVALAGVHHLAVDVSDARAVFVLEGAGAREVLAKIAPVDLHPAAFGPGDFRRTRLAQVAGAFWCEGEGRFGVVCLRSVADYVGALLRQSAADGVVGIF